MAKLRIEEAPKGTRVFFYKGCLLLMLPRDKNWQSFQVHESTGSATYSGEGSFGSAIHSAMKIAIDYRKRNWKRQHVKKTIEALLLEL